MPSNFVFANFFETELLDDISAEAAVLHVTPSMAARLPIIGEVMEARLVLWDGINSPEIVSVIDNQQTGYLSVLRARENTSSRPWPAGTQVICSLTAEIINAALQAYFDVTALLNASFLKLTGGTLTGPLVLPGVPTITTQAATKGYVDSILGNKLPLSGGVMLGSINMNGYQLLNLPAAVSPTEPFRKAEFDTFSTQFNAFVENNNGGILTAGTATAFTLANLGIQFTTFIDGLTFSARMHVANGVNATIAYSSQLAAPMALAPGVAVPERFLQAGQSYEFVYNAGLGTWLVKGAMRSSLRIRPGDLKWSAIEADHDDCFLCDGRSLPRVDFPSLFTNIGTKFGAVDGAHFNIPLMDGLTMVGRGNNLAVIQTLTTGAGSATATVGSATGLTVGMFVIPNSGNVSPGTKITDINGLTIGLSLVALASLALATRFSQISDPNVTGATGGVASRIQSRREVGQHLHPNTVGETPHIHTLNQLTGATVMSVAGGATNYAAGAFGAISAASGISLNTAVANVAITNVDSASPNASPMLSPAMALNCFIYVY